MARDNFEIILGAPFVISRLLHRDDIAPELLSIEFVGPMNTQVVSALIKLRELQETGEPLLITIKPKNIEVSCKPAGAGSESEHKE